MFFQTLSLRLSCVEKPGRERSVFTLKEFHISRKAREFYEFDHALFSLSGNVIFTSFLATRIFAKKINDKRNIAENPEKLIFPSQLNSMGLIDEILHYVIQLYQEENIAISTQALNFLERRLGIEATTKVLLQFSRFFPNMAVYRKELSEKEFLAQSSHGISHREVIMEEILMLWLANVNPAFGPYQELFDDQELQTCCQYRQFIEGLQEFFATKPLFGPDAQTLIDMLRSPAVLFPYSLVDQLRYMQKRWGLLLGRFLNKLLSCLDFIQEDRSISKTPHTAPTGYDTALVFENTEPEEERFSLDCEWMPRVILLAKSVLVWLDQLSKKYGQSIRTLDQIPDAELKTMAGRGFNALWLIGLWERSRASKQIKRMCGNPQAEASAYSLYDYEIAAQLGGWEALASLRRRAWQYGIRLASDMVPNHTAMDSRWISEHPDWFLQLDYCPFPDYNFQGRDLSQDPNIEIKLEDHYYDRTNAAVVFLHRDKNSSQVRFIYHGNDGTTMPWNDTAQINYLHPQAREAVIQTILHIARNFPIIRFDAAMTLAKRHVQRLWFPVPGTGSSISSRAEYGLSKSDFDKAMPKEFWREVVDRVAKEVPDTLLLAEAFWMMEGYFVRTLGMHRVYNSAFMHMFKNEQNEKYRHTIKNTLEFDPDILKRFVNFMNNPDEETAAAQFGTGDKYFGVTTLMVCLPGTPMFGHGQVEGFREKYGMEYVSAYWNEQEDQGLLARHEREIFPLLHKRYLFAEVEYFFFYDFWNSQGKVDHNVFAFSNGNGYEFALVIYNNSYEKTCGWIKTSVGYAMKKTEGKTLHQKDLISALGIQASANTYGLVREQSTNLWYIRPTQELQNTGLYIELNGYNKHVFWDMQVVQDSPEHPFSRLCSLLQGRGTSNIQEALQDITHQALFQGFGESFQAENFRLLYQAAWANTFPKACFWLEQEERLLSFYQQVKNFTHSQKDTHALAKRSVQELKNVFKFIQLIKKNQSDLTSHWDKLAAKLQENPFFSSLFFAGALLSRLGHIVDFPQGSTIAISLIEEWRLDKKLGKIFADLGMSVNDAYSFSLQIKLLVEKQDWLNFLLKQQTLLSKVLSGQPTQDMLQVHYYNGVRYFRQEGLNDWLEWIFALGAIKLLKGKGNNLHFQQKILQLSTLIEDWRKSAEQSGYLFDVWNKSSR